MPVNPIAELPEPTRTERAVTAVRAVGRRYSEVVLFAAGALVGALLVLLGRL